MNIRDRHFDPMDSGEWIRCIAANEFTKDELGWIFCCAMGLRGLLTDPENLTAVTKEMLDRGMDPNQLVTDGLPDEDSEESFYETPMITVTRYGGDPYEVDAAGAESLKLLLEHGGDPNTVYWSEGAGRFSESVFLFYVEDEFANGPDLTCGSFYGLLLCAAYGGKYPDGYTPFAMLIDAPISIFKEYSKYWYEYEQHESFSSTLYVVEKETGRRVAKYH